MENRTRTLVLATALVCLFVSATFAKVPTASKDPTGDKSTKTIERTLLELDAENRPKGLVLYYSFDDDEGSKVTDLSGNGNHGDCFGVGFAKAGEVEGHLSFDGQNDYIVVPGVHMRSFTFSALVQTPKTGRDLNNRRLFLLEGEKGLYALQGIHRGGLGFVAITHNRYGGEAETNEYDWQFRADTWTMIAITYDGTTVKLYDNGELIHEGRAFSNDEVAGTVHIGGNDAHGGRFWQGMMDDVVLFNRELSSEEIKDLHRITAERALHHHLSAPKPRASSDELMSIKVPEMSDDVVLRYSFDKDYGDEVLDESGRGNHAHAYGTKYVAEGQSGGCLILDGEDDFLAVRNIHLGNFTFSAFVKTLLPANKPNTNNRRLFLLHGGPRYYALQGNARGSIELTVTGHKSVGGRAWAFEAHTWTHITVTYEKPVVKLYKDGELTQVGQLDVNGVTGTLYIGGTERQYGRFWHGLMDEVAVFNRVLSEAEVQRLFKTNGCPWGSQEGNETTKQEECHRAPKTDNRWAVMGR